MEKYLLVVVYVYENLCAYLLGKKMIVHTNLTVLRYLMANKEAKLRLIRCILLLQDFNFEEKNQKSCENQVADYLSQLKSNNEK